MSTITINLKNLHTITQLKSNWTSLQNTDKGHTFKGISFKEYCYH